MGFNLPHLEKTTCLNLTVCGEVKDRVCKARLAKARVMVAKYHSGHKTGYLRVMPRNLGKHLHVDCARREFFAESESKLPKVTQSKAKALQVLEACCGSNIDATVAGYFRLDSHKLPERGIIRSLSTETGSAGLRVRLTAGTLSVSGAPITTVRWAVRGKKERMLLQVVGERSFTVSETYLEEALQWIGTMFQKFILGTPGNGDR
ncbi:MAG: hypothetical protein FJ288_01575 [Planctomycetes bacterium]|nr:hypothetical protein [Planctomycetota bacterium]